MFDAGFMGKGAGAIADAHSFSLLATGAEFR